MKRICCLLAITTVTLSSAAAELRPCVSAVSALSDFYGYVSPADAQSLKACVEANAICVLIDGHGVLKANTVVELKGKPPLSVFALVQVQGATESSCLAASYSGGSAASWLFDAWSVKAGEVHSVREFSSLQLDSDSVSPESLVALMQKAHSKRRGRGS